MYDFVWKLKRRELGLAWNLGGNGGVNETE